MLEKGAGQALFQRTPKGMMPVAVAREMAVNISRALNELRRIPEDIAARQGMLVGSIQIGALPLSRTRLLPEAVVKLIARHPGVQVITNESDFSTLVSGLRSGDIDLIVGALRQETEVADMVNEALFSEELVLLARPGHPLTQRAITPQDLSATQWILPRPATPARYLLQHAFLALGIAAPQPVVETGDLAMVRGLLLHSDMLAAVSSHQLEYEVKAGLLIALPLALPTTRRDIGLTFRHGALHSPATAALMHCLREVAADQSAE